MRPKRGASAWTKFRALSPGAQAVAWVAAALVVMGVYTNITDDSPVLPPRPAQPTTSTTVDIAVLYETTARVQCSKAYEDPSVRRIVDQTGEVGIRFAGDNFMSGFQSSESAPKDPAILRRVRVACEESLREAAGLP